MPTPLLNTLARTMPRRARMRERCRRRAPLPVGDGALRSILAATLVALAAPSLGAESAARAARPEHELSRPAPLGTLLDRVQQDFGGRVLKVELESEIVGGERRWVYEAKLLTPEGNVIEAESEGTTLALLEFEGEREPREREGDDD